MTPPEARSAARRRKRADEAAARLAKAFGHPLRMRVLHRLNEAVLSPSQLAAELEEPIATVSYHVRVLLDLGYLELVETRPRRGAIEHFYRAQSRAFLTDEDWAVLPEKTRKALTDAILQKIWQDIGSTLATGAFDARLDRHLSFTPLVLDEAGWDSLRDDANRLLERALELQAESAGRLQVDGGDEILTRFVLMLYTGLQSGGAHRREQERASAVERSE